MLATRLSITVRILHLSYLNLVAKPVVGNNDIMMYVALMTFWLFADFDDSADFADFYDIADTLMLLTFKIINMVHGPGCSSRGRGISISNR